MDLQQPLLAPSLQALSSPSFYLQISMIWQEYLVALLVLLYQQLFNLFAPNYLVQKRLQEIPLPFFLLLIYSQMIISFSLVFYRHFVYRPSQQVFLVWAEFSDLMTLLCFLYPCLFLSQHEVPYLSSLHLDHFWKLLLVQFRVPN